MVIWQTDLEWNSQVIDFIEGAVFHYDVESNVVQRVSHYVNLSSATKERVAAHKPTIVPIHEYNKVSVCWQTWENENKQTFKWARQINCRLHSINITEVDVPIALSGSSHKFRGASVKPIGKQFLVNVNDTEESQFGVALGAWDDWDLEDNDFTDGLFVVIWQSDPTDNDVYHINGRVVHDNDTRACCFVFAPFPSLSLSLHFHIYRRNKRG